MNKLSKYLSLLKFSITKPKSGFEIIQSAKGARDDSQHTILNHQFSSQDLVGCLNTLFPDSRLTKEDLVNSTREVESHFKSFFDSIKNYESFSKNKPYPTDYSIQDNSKLFLYALCKITQPELVVETGVAYGLSTSYILQALHENKHGMLYSIDSVFRPWETDMMIGSAIPDKLTNHWKLIRGSSKERLNDLLESLGQIDIFLHDSMHTYKNMIFEFETSWPHIKNNGFLLSDDISENNSFLEFYTSHNVTPILLSSSEKKPAFGIIQK